MSASGFSQTGENEKGIIMCEEELKDLKAWLFRENIRIKSENQDLESRKRMLQMEEELIQKKLEAIKRGFDELERDRQALAAREKAVKSRETTLSESYSDEYSLESCEVEDVLFRGADNILLLKMRYKNLMKIYHPDCVGGDTEMVQAINRAYDRQLKKYGRYENRRRA